MTDLLQSLLDKTTELEGELEVVTSSPINFPGVKSENTAPPDSKVCYLINHTPNFDKFRVESMWIWF